LIFFVQTKDGVLILKSRDHVKSKESRMNADERRGSERSRRSFIGRLGALLTGLSAGVVAGVPLVRQGLRNPERGAQPLVANEQAKVKVRLNPLAVPRTSTRSPHHG
jgi:hypothetical protein